MARNSYFYAVIAALFSPVLWSLACCLLAQRAKETDRAAVWLAHLRRMRALNLLAVPAWWSLSVALIGFGAKRMPNPDLPSWILFVLPLSVGTTAARILTNWTDRRIDARRWTVVDVVRLSLWKSLSSTVPLLLFALAIDAIEDRSLLGILWIGAAGILMLSARANLQVAEGFKPHIVKSGELFKRSFALAKEMGVRLTGIFVVPTGRGHLVKAYGVPGFIGMTDICVHRLHGAQLDFVIAHELAHVQQKHGRNNLRVAAAVYLGIVVLALALPSLPVFWSILFEFGAILTPLFVFYSVSRRFELAADRIAVEFTGDGEAAIRALANLYYREGVAAKRNKFDELLSGHPFLCGRIDAIARVGRVPAECVARIRGEYNDRSGGDPLPGASG